VYRSARLESVTEDGLQTLKNELGIKTDLDLRGKTEANTAMNKENPAGIDNYYLFVTPQYALAGDLGIDAPAHYESVNGIMSVFADKTNYPIDIHCAVGRDRTGTIVALLKSLLGYAENDIINDYFTSMFATTGAWEKAATYTNQVMIKNVVNYLNTFEGETLADRTANYLITKCGMSQAQIDSIRGIMVGSEEVYVPVYDTFEDTDNYSGYAFVTFEKFGTQKVVKAVALGETVAAPFEAGEGYTWTVDGQAFDFAMAVSGDITVKAVKANTYDVTVVSTGAVTAEETVTVVEGEAFDFATFEKSGYDFVVISSEGQVITSLTVSENTTINVIYVQR
jgi:protein tyrosine/serine phosphatase